MSKTAQRIVATMLEYAGHDDWDERPGGPGDMWRQGGFKKLAFKSKDFIGKRPGEVSKPETEGDEKAEPLTEPLAKPLAPKMSAHASRFQWKPKP